MESIVQRVRIAQRTRRLRIALSVWSHFGFALLASVGVLVLLGT